MRCMPRPLTILAAGTLAVILAATPALSGTGLGEGDTAIDFEGKEFVNSGPVSLKDLRGRLVLLELFSTT